jgi:hypothetical protein
MTPARVVDVWVADESAEGERPTASDRRAKGFVRGYWL